MSATLDTYLTIQEAGQLLRRKPWPIYVAIERGELRAFQPSGDGAWLIRPADLRAYVESWDSATVGASSEACCTCNT